MIFSHVKISYFLRVFKYDFSQWPKTLYNTYVSIINNCSSCSARHLKLDVCYIRYIGGKFYYKGQYFNTTTFAIRTGSLELKLTILRLSIDYTYAKQLFKVVRCNEWAARKLV
jgi:hypothetical protein